MIEEEFRRDEDEEDDIGVSSPLDDQSADLEAEK